MLPQFFERSTSQGHDVAPGARSRTWRGGSGAGERGCRESLFGSVEDAEALIGLGRQKGRWGGERGEGGGEGAGMGEEAEAEAGEDGICVSLPHMLAK